MKVLMLGWEYPPFNSGGLGVACKNLCDALTRQNISVSFMLPWRVKTDSKNIDFYFANDDLVVTDYKPFLSGYITSAEYERYSDSEKLLLEQDLFTKVLNYAARTARIAKKKSFNIFHAHDWLTFRAGISAKYAGKKPLVAHVHSTEFDRSGGVSSGNPFCKKIENEMMREADAVVAVSGYTKSLLVNEYSADPSTISVIHNGIDLGEFSSSPTGLCSLDALKKDRNKIVLYVGRLTLHKGADYFIRAAKKALQYNPKIYFLVVGSGEQEGQLVQLAASLGISDRVLFTGFLRGDELNQAYSKADLFILPSVSEPFGMTALESLSHRTPVMVSKQSGVSEVIPNSLKVDFWDVDEMVNKILSVLSHKTLHGTLSTEGRKDAERNTWDKAAKKCVDLYEGLLSRKAFAS